MELIVAVDEEWGIGNKGQLLAHVREDLMHFKRLTLGKTVILGSATLSTFPGGKPLKGRRNVILHPDPAFTVEGATVVHSLDELFGDIAAHRDDDYVVIGGASVYRQLLPHCDAAFVTKFHRSFEKDVYFENLDRHPDWYCASFGEVLLSDAATDTVAGMPYEFCVYRRKKPV